MVFDDVWLEEKSKGKCFSFRFAVFLFPLLLLRFGSDMLGRWLEDAVAVAWNVRVLFWPCGPCRCEYA